jgi:hypothetical protein
METSSSTSNFRRALTRLLLPVLGGIVALCFAVDRFFMSQVILKNTTAGSYKTYRIFNETHAEEIPILGSSRAAGSYVSELIDPGCFNYGIEKTQYTLVSIFLEQELKKDKSAPIIINWDYEFFRDYKANIAHFIPSVDQAPIARYMGSDMRWFYHVPALRFFGVYDDYVKSYIGERSGSSEISNGGFFVTFTPTPEQFGRMVEVRRKTAFVWDDPAVKEAAWEQLLTSTQRPIVLVVAPYHSAYFESFGNTEGAQAYLGKLDALPNVTVLDYGKMDLPDSCYQNTTHVNYTGAVVFSKELGRKLKEIALEGKSRSFAMPGRAGMTLLAEGVNCAPEGAQFTPSWWLSSRP